MRIYLIIILLVLIFSLYWITLTNRVERFDLSWAPPVMRQSMLTDSITPLGSKIHVTLDTDYNVVNESYSPPSAQGIYGCAIVPCPNPKCNRGPNDAMVVDHSPR